LQDGYQDGVEQAQAFSLPTGSKYAVLNHAARFEPDSRQRRATRIQGLNHPVGRVAADLAQALIAVAHAFA